MKASVPASAILSQIKPFPVNSAFSPGARKPSDAAGLARQPRTAPFGSRPFEGAVRGMSFAGNRRKYLSDIEPGLIEAEVEATHAARVTDGMSGLDLPIASAVACQRLG